MPVKVAIRGRKLVIKGLDKYKRKQGKQLMKAAHASGLVVQNEARRSVLKGPKTGKIYKRGRKEHQASAPGEPPASDTGTLANRIIVSVDATKLSVKVIAKTLYSWFLEYGTKRMKPRPFMFPALLNKRKQIAAIFNASLRK